MRRAEAHAGLGHAGAARLRDGERDPEVCHQRLPGLEQDVFGLDVAVHHTVAVRVFQRGGDGARQRHRIIHALLLLAVEPVA